MEELKTNLKTYRLQLAQIESAISGGQKDEELFSLQEEMTELISLTEESLLSYEKSCLLSLVDEDVSKLDKKDTEEDDGSNSQTNPCALAQSTGNATDDLMASFYADIASVDNDNRESSSCTSIAAESNAQREEKDSRIIQQSSSSPNLDSINKINSSFLKSKKQSEIDIKLNEDFLESIENLEDIAGTKCQAPYETEWTGCQYHNCMIMSAVNKEEQENGVLVEVLFLNPTIEKMRPCPYFLDGSCKFSVANCKFSHGHIVSLYDLRKFKEPDFSHFDVDSLCLAKHPSGIWHPATLAEILEDHQYTVIFSHQNLSTTLTIDDVLPREQPEDSDSSDDYDDSSTDDDAVVVIGGESLRDENLSTSLGGWERFTRGFGSKMLLKYGYKMGEGLGKDKKGRVEPVPVVVLPTGKSLDHCMKLKERKNGVNDGASTSCLSRRRHRPTVFHFLNKTLGGKKEKGDYLNQLLPKDSFGIKKQKSKAEPCKIQMELVKNDSKIRQLKENIKRYKESVVRNKIREPTVAKKQQAKLEQDIAELRAIQSTSNAIEAHQARADTHRKMTRF